MLSPFQLLVVLLFVVQRHALIASPGRHFAVRCLGTTWNYQRSTIEIDLAGPNAVCQAYEIA